MVLLSPPIPRSNFSFTYKNHTKTALYCINIVKLFILRLLKLLVVNARFLTQPLTGVQRYSLEISKALKSIDPSIRFVAPKNILDTQTASELNVELIGSRTGHIWEQYDLPKYLNSCGRPTLLNLANTAPIAYSKKISTLHDIAFERYPESFSWRFRKAYQLFIPIILNTSLKIITVSEFSRKEISSFYSINNSKICVIPNAVSGNFTKTLIASEKYLLAVSSINRQKNFIGLIDAYIKTKTNDHCLYIVGDINNNFSNTELLDKIKSDPRIKMIGRVSDEELISLYSGASAFIYPSFYEGFGIPPLEAQACGCPVISSNAASLPEVCKDSVIYCNPHDIIDMAKKIDLVLSTPSLGADLISKGYNNIKRFSWELSAKRLLNSIREIT